MPFRLRWNAPVPGQILRLSPVTASVALAIATSTAAVPPPGAVLPTIYGARVSVRWDAPPAPDGWTLLGYHVYRAASEGGPWTRLTSSPSPAGMPAEYLDASPGDLASSFYAVTALATNGAATAESARSEAGQAASNLVHNPSFEVVGSDGRPDGWEMAVWSGGGWSWGAGLTEHADGARAGFLQAGAFQADDEYGWPLGSNTAALVTAPERNPAVTPGEVMVSGVYARLQGASGSSSALMRPAWLEGNPPAATGWYQEATDVLGATDASWRWLADPAGHSVRASSESTRLALLWDVDGATPAGARAYFDELRYQVRRVGPTGSVFGRVQDARGLPVAGASVSAAGRSAAVDPYLGQYFLRNLPTGPVTLTVSVPGQPDRTLSAANYGGARAPDLTLDQALPLALVGTVTTADRVPLPGARVTAVAGPSGAAEELTAVTGPDGRYRIEGVPATNLPARVYATKAGYTTASLNGTAGRPLGLAGVAVVDLELGRPQQVIEAARAQAPPVLDGVVSPGEWDAAAPVNLWFRHLTGSLFPYADRAVVLWDSASLYVALTFQEPNTAGVVAAAHGEDAWTDTNNIFNVDDTASVFLDPSRGILWGAGHEAWQVTTNYNQADPASVDLVMRRGPESLHDKAFDIAGLAFASRVDAAAGMLTTELRIPFEGLSVPGGWDGRAPSEGEEWGVLFGRYRRQTGESGATSRTHDWWGSAEQFSALRFVPSAGPVSKGDLDGDRAVTLADAAESLRVWGGLSALWDRLPQADVAGPVGAADGAVEMHDVVAIARLALGLP